MRGLANICPPSPEVLIVGIVGVRGWCTLHLSISYPAKLRLKLCTWRWSGRPPCRVEAVEIAKCPKFVYLYSQRADDGPLSMIVSESHGPDRGRARSPTPQHGRHAHYSVLSIYDEFCIHHRQPWALGQALAEYACVKLLLHWAQSTIF